MVDTVRYCEQGSLLCLQHRTYSSDIWPLPWHGTRTRSDAAGATMEYCLWRQRLNSHAALPGRGRHGGIWRLRELCLALAHVIIDGLVARIYRLTACRCDDSCLLASRVRVCLSRGRHGWGQLHPFHLRISTASLSHHLLSASNMPVLGRRFSTAAG